jgi:hypothetical protein
MKRGHVVELALLAALAAGSLSAQIQAFDATLQPSCPAGRQWVAWLLNESSGTDCDNVAGGSTAALCACSNGSVSAVGGGGSATDTFRTIDLPAGTDPVADSSSDTLTVTCPVPMACTGTSTPDTWAITWSGAMPAAQLVNAAPYGLLDPLKPPASAGTGGCVETFHGGAEVCHAAGWFNQDTATVAFNQGSAVLIGDTTNELHGRAIAAATNADQTYTAQVAAWFPGASTDSDMCGIAALAGGTLASPSSVAMLIFGNQTTDGFWYITDTDFAPGAGATTNASVSWFLENFRYSYSCLQLRYTDSSRALLAYYSTTPDCTDWTPLGTAVTLASDPLYWGYLARRAGACRFKRIQNRTDANRDVWGDP